MVLDLALALARELAATAASSHFRPHLKWAQTQAGNRTRTADAPLPSRRQASCRQPLRGDGGRCASVEGEEDVIKALWSPTKTVWSGYRPWSQRASRAASTGGPGAAHGVRERRRAGAPRRPPSLPPTPAGQGRPSRAPRAWARSPRRSRARTTTGGEHAAVALPRSSRTGRTPRVHADGGERGPRPRLAAHQGGVRGDLRRRGAQARVRGRERRRVLLLQMARPRDEAAWRPWTTTTTAGASRTTAPACSAASTPASACPLPPPTRHGVQRRGGRRHRGRGRRAQRRRKAGDGDQGGSIAGWAVGSSSSSSSSAARASSSAA